MSNSKCSAPKRYKAEESPMENVVILSTVFDHFTLSELKNARLVSCLWNDIAQKLWRRRIIFRIFDNKMTNYYNHMTFMSLECLDPAIFGQVIDIIFGTKNDNDRAQRMFAGLERQSIIGVRRQIANPSIQLNRSIGNLISSIKCGEMFTHLRSLKNFNVYSSNLKIVITAEKNCITCHMMTAVVDEELKGNTCQREFLSLQELYAAGKDFSERVLPTLLPADLALKSLTVTFSKKWDEPPNVLIEEIPTD